MIYALIDKETLNKKGLSLSSHLQHLSLFLNIPLLQYRNKISSLDEKIEDLLTIKKYYKGILIINDDIELISYGDGLHLGQEDLLKYSSNLNRSVTLIRKEINSKILGVSTHNKKEILETNKLEIDYIGLGAYRATDTKGEAIVGGEELIKISKHSTHPVAIIGGVKLDDKFEAPIIYRAIGSGLYKT